MPSEYRDLVAALQQTGIPFEEYGWKPRPEGIHGVVSLDMEAGNLNGDGQKADRSWEASVDVFFPKLADRNSVMIRIEDVLRSICGSSWDLNSIQYETQTGLFHVEWLCAVFDNPDGAGV